MKASFFSLLHAKDSLLSPGFMGGYGVMRLPGAEGTAIKKFEGTSPEGELRLILPSNNSRILFLEIFGALGQFYGSGASQNATVTYFGGGAGFTVGFLSLSGGYWRNRAKTTGGGYENSISFPSLSVSPSIRIPFSSKLDSSFLSLGCKVSKAVHNITVSGGTSSVPVTSWNAFLGISIGLGEFF